MSPKWFDPRRFLGFSPSTVDDFLKNEAVRATLRQQGDKGKAPRPIEHYAYFPTCEGLDSYREFITSRGYKVEREDVSARGTEQLVIIFSKVQAPAAIDNETVLLGDHARQRGGDYDGWETEVVRRP